jgi:hypothetical protein
MVRNSGGDEKIWVERYQLEAKLYKSFKKKKYTGNKGAVRDGCLWVMPTQVFSTLVLMAEKGKQGSTPWKLTLGSSLSKQT